MKMFDNHLDTSFFYLFWRRDNDSCSERNRECVDKYLIEKLWGEFSIGTNARYIQNTLNNTLRRTK